MTDTKPSSSPLTGICITIDGPSASGKGTLARRLAKHFRMKYLDTGAIYRTAAWQVLSKGVDPQDTAAVLPLLIGLNFDFKHVGNNTFGMFVDGEVITTAIRKPNVGDAASLLAIQPEVREALYACQRQFAERWVNTYGVILDGRDCGGRIYPRAQLKFFVDADPAVRAERRQLEFAAQGIDLPLADIAEKLAARDARDAPNTIKTADAVVIDCTAINADEVLANALTHIQHTFTL